MRIAAIKAPLFSGKDILEDIAAFSGASVLGDRQSIHREYALHSADPVRVLGKVKTAKLTASETVLRGVDDQSVAERVQQRLDWLNTQLQDDMVGEHDSD